MTKDEIIASLMDQLKDANARITALTDRVNELLARLTALTGLVAEHFLRRRASSRWRSRS